MSTDKIDPQSAIVISRETPSQANGGLNLTMPNGKAVTIHTNGKASKKAAAAKNAKQAVRRPIVNVAVALRHSIEGDRSKGHSGTDNFFAANNAWKNCVQRCQQEGWNIVDADAYLDFSGGEMALRLAKPLGMMRRGEIDALVVPRLDRYARTEEAHAVNDEIRSYGCSLISVQDNFCIWNPRDKPIIGFLIGKAAGDYEEHRERYKDINTWKVEQGVHKHGYFGYEWVLVPHDVTLPAGTPLLDTIDPVDRVLEDGRVERHYKRGSLKPLPAEFPFSAGILTRLDANEPPDDIIAWLHEHGHQAPSRKRKDDTFFPRQDWTRESLLDHARSEKAKGWAQFGDAVNENAHVPLVDDALWERVNAKIAPGSAGRRVSPDKRATRLLEHVLRCQGCRSKMYYSPSLGAWRCGSGKTPKCPAFATAQAHLIEPHIEARLLEGLRARVTELMMKPMSATDSAELAEAEAIEARGDNLYRIALNNKSLMETNIDAYNDAVAMAHKVAIAGREGVAEARADVQTVCESQQLLDDWADMDIDTQADWLARVWPLIWVRKGEHIADCGSTRRRPLAERVWEIGPAAAREYVLPRKGWEESLERHMPIEWHDGSTNVTADNKRSAKMKAVWADDTPADLARVAASPEEAARWLAAREQFKAEGCSDEAVVAAVQAAGGKMRVAAREVGMTNGGVRARMAKLARESGEVELSVKDERRQKDYAANGCTDEDIADALALYDGHMTKAAQRLGMPLTTLWHRHAKMNAA